MIAALLKRWRRRQVQPSATTTTPDRSGPLDLALIIAVKDEATGLARLLEQAHAMACFTKIVVVDHGSMQAVTVPPGVGLLRLSEPQDAARAHRAGLHLVRSDYVMCLEATDRLTAELSLLLEDLACQLQPFDLCLFHHADSRVAAEGRWGLTDHDSNLWAMTGHGCNVLAEVDHSARIYLAQTTPVACNRISRTAFLTSQGNGSDKEPSDHDITAARHSITLARRLLVSDRVCVWHPCPGADEDHRNDEPGPGSDIADHAGRQIGKVGNDGAISFICVLRDAARSFMDLAEDLREVARPGDQLILIDDGSGDQTRRLIGRFGATEGWGGGVAVETVLMATRGKGDTAIATNLGLARVRRPWVMVLTGDTRLDRSAFQAIRAMLDSPDMTTGDAPDLWVSPVAVHDLDDPATPMRPMTMPGLAGMLIHRSLLAQPDMRCDEGRPAHGDLALAGRLVARAARMRQHRPALVTYTARPVIGPDLLAAAADLLQAQPQAVDWLLANLPHWLASAEQGSTSGLLQDGPAFRCALPSGATLPDAPMLIGLLNAWHKGHHDTARRYLRGLGQAAVLLAAPATTGARLRIWMEGPHTRRTPFAYPALTPCWQDRIIRADSPQDADLLICAHPRDLPAMPREMAGLAHRKPFVLLSEEPFWDSLFSPDPLAGRITLPAGHAGQLRLHQVNHHRSPIFDFDRIPYFLLTDPRYLAAYARLFSRNAARSAADWQADIPARPLRSVFMAERRTETFHDLTIPQGDIVGLCAWRTRLALACTTGEVRRMGASWEGGTPRVQIDDWHGDKIRRLDGRVQIMSAVENTHQPAYLSEKIFDAFALGAVPAYVANDGHRLHDLDLPPDSWINLWGMDAAQAARRIDDADLTGLPWADYASAQHRLAALFTDPDIAGAERDRLRRAVLAEVTRLIDIGPA